MNNGKSTIQQNASSLGSFLFFLYDKKLKDLKISRRNLLIKHGINPKKLIYSCKKKSIHREYSQIYSQLKKERQKERHNEIKKRNELLKVIYFKQIVSIT